MRQLLPGWWKGWWRPATRIAVRPYEGIKHIWSDALWLAHLLRLELLPEGYIYLAAQRPVRDAVFMRPLLESYRQVW
jgi:transposase